MSKAAQGVRLVIALTVTALVVGFVLTVGIGALVDDNVSDVTQTQGETLTLEPRLNATLDAVNNTANDVSVTLTDTSTGSSSSITNISVGSSQTTTLEGHTIEVYADAVNSGTEAELRYQVPQVYGYSTGAAALYNILDLIIVLLVAIMMFGWALDVFR